MRLVLGLGNPGERYALTRHNVAWRVLDEIAGRRGAREGGGGPTFRVRHVRVAEQDMALLTPLTFMNASGEALREWEQRQGLDAGRLLVVSDDVYLPLGTLRLRARGSSGGHRGLDSVESALGHRDYARLRVGVGAARDAAGLRAHVLEAFAPEEARQADEAVRAAADAVECWATRGLLAAMNEFNRRARREVSEP